LCACDAGALFAIDTASGRVLGDVALSGAPGVIFLDPQSGHLYVAISDPGVIDVIDIGTMRRAEVVPTEAGAHTLALDRKRSKIYSFLPQSHRAAVFVCRYNLMEARCQRTFDSHGARQESRVALPSWRRPDALCRAVRG
jgi:DNA-binding beta-propeller fold protein YncE